MESESRGTSLGLILIGLLGLVSWAEHDRAHLRLYEGVFFVPRIPVCLIQSIDGRVIRVIWHLGIWRKEQDSIAMHLDVIFGGIVANCTGKRATIHPARALPSPPLPSPPSVPFLIGSAADPGPAKTSRSRSRPGFLKVTQSRSRSPVPTRFFNTTNDDDNNNINIDINFEFSARHLGG